MWFAVYGLLEEVVADNGPQFIPNEFVRFLKLNGVKQIGASLPPIIQSAAARTVQILKRVLKKQAERVKKGGKQWSLKHQMANCLFQYRNIPHLITGVIPAELFLKCGPCTKFTILPPNLQEHVQNQQVKQRQHNKNRVK